MSQYSLLALRTSIQDNSCYMITHARHLQAEGLPFGRLVMTVTVGHMGNAATAATVGSRVVSRYGNNYFGCAVHEDGNHYRCRFI